MARGPFARSSCRINGESKVLGRCVTFKTSLVLLIVGSILLRLGYTLVTGECGAFRQSAVPRRLGTSNPT
jgi:hypothetical protein